MVISVISLFTHGLLEGISCSSSLEESESVASWSVSMILMTFCWVFLLALLTGSLSLLSSESFIVDCTDMLKQVRDKGSGNTSYGVFGCIKQ